MMPYLGYLQVCVVHSLFDGQGHLLPLLLPFSAQLSVQRAHFLGV
jgi:hypothetical protein